MRTGSAPPALSMATPRSARVRPSSSTSAFGRPNLDPCPAASNPPATALRTIPKRMRAAAVAARRCRPQGLAGELVVDPALGGGQRVAGAAPAELNQLGGYRYRGLLRRPGPEIKPDR